MARPKLRLLCTSMLVAILLFLYAALLCSCKTAAPEISGTMWVELSLDGQYALTNAAGQTLRYFDLLQYDGTMPVEKTHLNGGEAAYSASLCVPRTETLTVEVTDGSLFSASWKDESQFRKIEGSVRKIVLSDKTTSVETAGEAYTLTVRMPGRQRKPADRINCRRSYADAEGREPSPRRCRVYLYPEKRERRYCCQADLSCRCRGAYFAGARHLVR